MACKQDDPTHGMDDLGGISGAVYELREGQEELDLLLGVVMDSSQPVSERIKAADKLAPFRHAKKSEPPVVITFDMAGFLAELRRERSRLDQRTEQDEARAIGYQPPDFGKPSGGCM